MRVAQGERSEWWWRAKRVVGVSESSCGGERSELWWRAKRLVASEFKDRCSLVHHVLDEVFFRVKQVPKQNIPMNGEPDPSGQMFHLGNGFITVTVLSY